MAPYGERRVAALADHVSNEESSLDSSFFKDIDTLKDSGSGSIETEDYDSFSVQTPSVNDADSDGSFSDSTDLDSATMDMSKAVSTVATQSVATPSVDIDDISVNTPSVHSVGIKLLRSSSARS